MSTTVKVEILPRVVARPERMYLTDGSEYVTDKPWVQNTMILSIVATLERTERIYSFGAMRQFERSVDTNPVVTDEEHVMTNYYSYVITYIDTDGCNKPCDCWLNRCREHTHGEDFVKDD